MGAWPGTLPSEPLIANNSEQAPDVVARTEMSVGPAKVRRRVTAGYSPTHWVFLMTDAQLSTFLTFFNDTSEGGAETWTITHPRTAGSETMRFIGQPAWYKRGPDKWIVEFDCELMP